MSHLIDKTSSLVLHTSTDLNSAQKTAQAAPFMAGPEYPGMNPPAISKATQAIWQDPSSYDPFSHSPPYLPSPRVARIAKEAFVVASGLELAGLLTMLRAVAIVHQTHHWVAQGANYYADHLLFDRLYSDLASEIDQVAERAVGGGGSDYIRDFQGITAGVVRVLDGLGEATSSQASDLVQKSLEAEELLLDGITLIVGRLKASDSFTRGTDNLIAGIEDKHEEHKYLLQQRLSAVDWKTGPVV